VLALDRIDSRLERRSSLTSLMIRPLTRQWTGWTSGRWPVENLVKVHSHVCTALRQMGRPREVLAEVRVPVLSVTVPVHTSDLVLHSKALHQ
jgi:hypothetical protein